MPHRIAQCQPLLVGHGGNRDITGLRFVNEVDEGGGALLADVLAYKSLATHIRGPEEVHNGIQHRDANVLAFAGFELMKERARYRLSGDNPGEFVGQDGSNESWSEFI